jgi:hypothetical protein
MRHGLFLVLMIPCALTCAAPAAEPEPATNAALKYWLAYVNMNFDKEQEKLLDNWNKAPLDAAADKILDNSKNILQQMHRGAQIERCDWGLDYEDGPGMLLPHLGKARLLTKVAALHMRRDFARKNAPAAVQTAVDALTMARHCNSDFTLISLLVRFVDELTIFDALAPQLPKLDAASLTKLATALDAPVGGYTVSDSLIGEKKYMAGWLVRKLKEAEAQKAGSYKSVFEAVLGPQESKEEESRTKAAIEAADTFEKAVKMVESLYPVYDELARLYALQPKEFDAKYPEYDRRIKADNQMAALLLPGLSKVSASQRRNQAQRALMRAAISIVQGGPEKAKETRDPFGDGTFEYRPFEGGFELKSKFQFKDAPVTLLVGEEKK